MVLGAMEPVMENANEPVVAQFWYPGVAVNDGHAGGRRSENYGAGRPVPARVK